MMDGSPRFDLLSADEWSRGLQIAQLIVLVLILRALHRICDELREARLPPTAAPLTQGAGQPLASASVPKPPASPKPTVATLEAESGTQVLRAPPDWAPLSESELDVIRQLKEWFGSDSGSRARFDSIPHDMLVCFVRGFQYRNDWPRAACAYLDACLQWREQTGLDQAIWWDDAQLPPKRELYERLQPSGVVGVDAKGRPVIVDRPPLEPAEFLDHFDQHLLARHLAYTHEAIRAHMIAVSHARKVRMLKSPSPSFSLSPSPSPSPSLSPSPSPSPSLSPSPSPR